MMLLAGLQVLLGRYSGAGGCGGGDADREPEPGGGGRADRIFCEHAGDAEEGGGGGEKLRELLMEVRERGAGGVWASGCAV